MSVSESSFITGQSSVATGWISCPRCSRRSRAGTPYCEYCGEQLAAIAPEAATPRRTFVCSGCGAAVQFPEGERTASCAFCAAPYVAQGETSSDRQPPEFVLPFSVVQPDAEKAFRQWLARRALFAPSDLARRASLSRIRGVYVPFWTFSTRSESAWSARIGEHWWETITETYTEMENGKPVTKTRTRQVQRTEWYPLEGRFHQFHSHYLVSASRGLSQAVVDRIAPFPVSEMSRYAPHFLSGWLAEEYSIERDAALQISMKEFEEREHRDIAAFLPGDTHADLRVSTDFYDTTEDLAMLPVWIFAYRYGDRTLQYVLNGATGREHGEKPISPIKVALFVLAILAAIGILIFLARSRG